MGKIINFTELLDKIDNKYKMVIVASKRARQLNLGAEKKAEITMKKMTTMALYEIVNNKIKIYDGKEEKKSKVE